MAKTPECDGLLGQPDVPQLSRDYQRPQAQEARHAPGYDNEVPPNWLRGMGKGEATGKPAFDKKRSG